MDSDKTTGFQHVAVLGGRECEHRVLLHQDDRDVQRVDLLDDLPISAVMIGESPIDGSSSRSSFGRVIRARAMASICCSPPESEPASCHSRSRKIGEMLIDHDQRAWRDPE